MEFRVQRQTVSVKWRGSRDRNRVEFRDPWELDEEDGDDVEIETEWNLEDNGRVMSADYVRVEIETEWNLEVRSAWSMIRFSR